MDRLDLTSAPLLARDADIIILGDFNFGRDVRVVVIDTDRYERSVGWV